MTEFLLPHEKLPYNPKSIASIFKHACKLLTKSLKEHLESEGKEVPDNKRGKGSLGQKVEELHFYIKNNSLSRPDFDEIGLELKTTPLKSTRKGLRSKERLVLSKIDYVGCAGEGNFETSSFWKKNKHLLILFYLHKKDLLDVDYLFKKVLEWKFPAADLKIIREDWHKIQKKIEEQLAHELSERDTLYLSASTKGATSEDRTFQRDGAEAKPRAFSLKSRYLNSILGEEFKASETASKTPGQARGETFEEWIANRFLPHLGKSESQLIREFHVISPAKQRHQILATRILGLSGKRIAEFEKAEIKLKVIRLGKRGRPKESMSFRNIVFKEIVAEEWEDSKFHEDLNRRFFFVVFRADNRGVSRLLGVRFWGMPERDFEVAKSVWQDTKDKIGRDDHSHFTKIKDDSVAHVRPKGRNSKDLMTTPQGTRKKKKCFWLNARYIYSQLQGIGGLD